MSLTMFIRSHENVLTQAWSPGLIQECFIYRSLSGENGAVNERKSKSTLPYPALGMPGW